jgi:hypothetical protein
VGRIPFALIAPQPRDANRLACKAEPPGNLFEWSSLLEQLQHHVDRLLTVLEIPPPLAFGTTE